MTETTDPIDPDNGPDSRDDKGNLLDGCGDEHAPASNAGCMAAPHVEDPVVLSKPEPAAPDMTHIIVRDMVEGVKRYEGIAAEAAKQAEEYRAAVLSREEEHAEYVGKAAALSALLTRLGYDPATGDRVIEDSRITDREPVAFAGDADVVAVDTTLKSVL